MNLSQKQEGNFWDKVEKTDSCWLWKGSSNKFGHGRFKVGRKAELAHRVSFFLAHNFLPNVTNTEGMMLHKCGNPSCVNPIHLYIGTMKDNAIDRTKDGTQVHLPGAKNGRALLTEEKAKKIREDSKSRRVADIAREYGVSWSCVDEIKRGLSWKNI